MKIELITSELYKELTGYFNEYPSLFLQNTGYEEIDKKDLTETETVAFKRVEDIIKKHIYGCTRFQNFRLCKKHNKPQIRLQYNYNYDGNNGSFYGVGYILLDELLNGFN